MAEREDEGDQRPAGSGRGLEDLREEALPAPAHPELQHVGPVDAEDAVPQHGAAERLRGFERMGRAVMPRPHHRVVLANVHAAVRAVYVEAVD